MGYPDVIYVGLERHEVSVTNRAKEAEAWFQSLPTAFTPPGKIVGVSFSWASIRDQTGFVTERVQSIHFSHQTRVLVLFLGAACLEQLSDVVFAFLHHPDNVLVGMDAGPALEVLRVFRAGPLKARVVSLWDAASLAGVVDVVAKKPIGGPMYRMMVDLLLLDVDSALLMDPELLQRGSWEWPLSSAQVVCAAQTAVVCEKIGLAAFFVAGPNA